MGSIQQAQVLPRLLHFTSFLRLCIGSSEGSPLMHGQAPALDQAAARDMAKAAVARRDATSRLADQERRLADMHATSAGVFQRAAKDAFDQGEQLVSRQFPGRPAG